MPTSSETSEASKPVALVTGGSRGLGEAIVARLLEAGYRVATCSRSRTPFVETAEAKSADDFLWRSVDAFDLDAVEAFALETMRTFGRLDALVCNAAVLIDGPLALSTRADIERTLDLNLKTNIVLAQVCSRFMLRQRSGAIVFISSLNAVQGNKGVAVYSATKAGLDGLARSLARELGPRGIRVNSVAPGYMATEMSAGLAEHKLAQILRRTPLRALGKVEQVAEAVYFMVSPSSAFVTGQTLVVDGGLTC